MSTRPKNDCTCQHLTSAPPTEKNGTSRWGYIISSCGQNLHLSSDGFSTPNSNPVIVSPQVLHDVPNSILAAHVAAHDSTLCESIRIFGFEGKKQLRGSKGHLSQKPVSSPSSKYLQYSPSVMQGTSYFDKKDIS